MRAFYLGANAKRAWRKKLSTTSTPSCCATSRTSSRLDDEDDCFCCRSDAFIEFRLDDVLKPLPARRRAFVAADDERDPVELEAALAETGGLDPKAFAADMWVI